MVNWARGKLGVKQKPPQLRGFFYYRENIRARQDISGGNGRCQPSSTNLLYNLSLRPE